MWCFFKVIISKHLNLLPLSTSVRQCGKKCYFSVNFALCSSDFSESVTCSSFLLMLLTLKTVVRLYLRVCRHAFCLSLRYFMCVWPCIPKFTNKFLSPSLLILNLEKKASPHHMGFGFSLQMAKWLYSFPVERSAPLCVLLLRKKTPEYFLGVEEGPNPPSLLGVVFRLQ